MKSFIAILSCIILMFIVFEKSGAFVVGSRTVREGAIKVEKTSWEWHPEKIGPYLTVCYNKWVGRFFKTTVSPIKKVKNFQKLTHRLVLKNGTAILGHVVRKDESGILFRSEGGEIYFGHDEIISIEAK